MKRATSFIKDYLRSHDGDKTRTHSLSVVLNTVLDMITTQRNADGGTVVQGQSDLYQALMLPELADMLLQLITKKVGIHYMCSKCMTNPQIFPNSRNAFIQSLLIVLDT